jgi:hypothetical protein
MPKFIYCVKNFTIAFLAISLFANYTYSFNWTYYKEYYPDLVSSGITNDLVGFYHFLSYGIHEKKLGAKPFKNTNFDWYYYKTINNLEDINSNQQAYAHYETQLKIKKLVYCKRFKILIFLHLYNLDQIDEFIEKINYFMHINPCNDFHIKINIPIGTNVELFHLQNATPQIVSNEKAYNFLSSAIACKEHAYLLTQENCVKLYTIYNYIFDKIKLPTERMQIILSENRGLDIGGFLLLLDQTYKQNLPYDFIVKIHTKTAQNWREVLTSLLNLRINKLLNYADFVYSCNLSFDWHSPTIPEVVKPLTQLFDFFKLPKKNFDFSPGTMFIISDKIVDFFKNYDLITLYNMLHLDIHYQSNRVGLEHAYEWLFGYLAQYSGLKRKIVGYVERSLDPLLN